MSKMSSSNIIIMKTNMFTKILSLLSIIIILKASLCQSLAIPNYTDKNGDQQQPSNQQNLRQQDLTRISNDDHHQQRTQRSSITSEPLWDGKTSKFIGSPSGPRALLLSKRSIGDDTNSAYAGHSIMRFGRAPHNIMHFGKRSNNEDDTAAIMANQLESMANQATDSPQQSSDDYYAQSGTSLRYLLVPIMLSPSSSYTSSSISHPYMSSTILSNQEPLRHYLAKKSTENLESSRGVFMHFG